MILDELYLGNICPAEDAIANDPEYQRLNDAILAELRKLQEALSEDQMELVNQFHAKVLDLLCYETAAKFKYGFALGIKTIQDVNILI